LLFTLYTITEAVTRINPTGIVLNIWGSEVRLGIKRAAGPFLLHPIACGLSQVLLLPLALEAGRRARTAGGRPWWRCLPWLACGSIVVTVSRGAWLAMALTLGIDFFFRNRRLRPLLLGLALTGGVVLETSRDAFIDLMCSITGEANKGDVSV